jgi:TRAP-type C4-dicarboxylate transport system permease small subunit
MSTDREALEGCSAGGGPLPQFVVNVCRWGVWSGGVLLLVAAVLIGIEVVIRKFFGATLGGASELGGYALAIGSAWAYSFALLERAHIRIDTLYTQLPAYVCAILDILGLVLFIAFFGMVTWYAYGTLQLTYENNSHAMTPLHTPLVYPQLLWFAGLCWFMVTAIILLLRALALITRKDIGGVRRILGSRSAKEEVDEELPDVR